MDEDDVRYDVFSMIYDMLFDNIQLRVKQNKLSSRVLSQSQLNIDKAVSGYFRKNQKSLLADAQKETQRLKKERLQNAQNHAPGKIKMGTTPGG